MRTLDVPTSSFMDIRKAPAKVFALAKARNNPVYVFNRGIPEGVVMTTDQFEFLTSAYEKLQDLKFDNEVKQRLEKKNVRTFSDSQVRSKKSIQNNAIDEFDGWE